jgi:CMP-N,N'-diacetyllegionaminic acid synthase
MSILCTICARGGSKGIVNKALKKINKRPLISYTIRQAVKSKIFDEIVVSTDSLKIQKIARIYGAKSWFLRPKNLSNDNTPKLPAIRHALIISEKFFKKKFDICFDLDLTSPLRAINDIKNAIRKFKRSNCNNLFSVNYAKKNPYFNMVEKKNKTFSLVKKINKNFYSRQKSPKVFEMNSSIYIYKRKFLMDRKNLFTNKTSIFLMPRNRSIDIDDALDLKLIKKIIKYDKRLFK